MVIAPILTLYPVSDDTVFDFIHVKHAYFDALAPAQQAISYEIQK